MTPSISNSRQRPIVKTTGLVLCLAMLAAPQPAPAQDIKFVLHAEPAAAFWVDDPQSEHFTPGFYGAIRPGVALGRVVSLQWSYAFLGTPAAKGFSEAGGAHFLTAGLRLRPLATLRPEEDQLAGLFVDGNLGYVRTGDLDRFGFDAGLGYNFQTSPGFALGPVVRYAQIVQPQQLAAVDLNDAQFVTVGLNLSFGTPHHEDKVEIIQQPALECPEAPPTPEPLPVPECVAVEKAAAVAVCPDADADGVCDSADRCPTQPGPAGAFGCAVDPCGGTPLHVLVQFPFDSARLPSPDDSVPQSMDPVLDAVAAAMAQDPTCRVCVVGHASPEGEAYYNLNLSKERATAVRAYLTSRGLDRSRIPTTGVGESCPLVPEASLGLNRRVEFRRLDEGESCPADCSE